MKTRELHIKNSSVEIKICGEIVEVVITDVGVYEQVGELFQFTYDNGEKDISVATVINRLLEVM